MKHLGIYPGTFDPIHDGHISFALNAIEKCGLDGVIFLPENQPRSKVNVTPPQDRLQQIKAMIHAYPKLDAHLLESSQFTVATTLPEIQHHFKNTKLTLLIGSDVVLSLAQWNDIDTLLEVCDVAIGMRSNQTEQEVQVIITKLKQLAQHCLFAVVLTDYPSMASSTFRK